MAASEDIVIRIRDGHRAIVGVIPFREVDFEMHDVFNGVGTWTVKARRGSTTAALLGTPGAGIVVTDTANSNLNLMSGFMTSTVTSVSKEDPVGMVTISGVTDAVILADRLCFKDTRSGTAETVMHILVNGAAGPAAVRQDGGVDSSRRTTGVQLGTNGVRGASVSVKVNWDNLGATLAMLAHGSGLGFRCVYRGTYNAAASAGQLITFETYLPVNRSYIKLSVEDGTLESASIGESTWPLNRSIVNAPGAFSTYTNNSGYRLIEEYEVKNNLTSATGVTDYQGAKFNGMTTDGTSIDVRAVPVGDTRLRYGKDWNLGDTISVGIGDVISSRQITGVKMRIGPSGIATGFELGDTSNIDRNEAAFSRMATTAAKVEMLERDDTGLVISGFTASPGWVITTATGRRRSGVTSVSLKMERTGANIQASTTGNITDTALAVVPADFKPANPVYGAFTTGWTGGGCVLDIDGTIVLWDMHSSSTIVAGQYVRVTFSYIT